MGGWEKNRKSLNVDWLLSLPSTLFWLEKTRKDSVDNKEDADGHEKMSRTSLDT